MLNPKIANALVGMRQGIPIIRFWMGKICRIEIKAYVVPNDGFDDAAALKAWARSQLADYKYPREIEFRDSLPMTATGKMLKRELKAEATQSNLKFSPIIK